MLKEIQNYSYQHIVDFDFTELCLLLKAQKYPLAISKIETFVQQIDLSRLYFDSNNYTRNIIIDNKTFWLGLLNWDKGASTRIHGHPDQAFIYVVKGVLSCQNFEKNPLTKTKKSILSSGESRHNVGVKNKMDNYIHQIYAKEKSLTLHFYSDNPSKGEIFDY
jgi:hypothetical protein